MEDSDIIRAFIEKQDKKLDESFNIKLQKVEDAVRGNMKELKTEFFSKIKEGQLNSNQIYENVATLTELKETFNTFEEGYERQVERSKAKFDSTVAKLQEKAKNDLETMEEKFKEKHIATVNKFSKVFVIGTIMNLDRRRAKTKNKRTRVRPKYKA